MAKIVSSQTIVIKSKNKFILVLNQSTRVGPPLKRPKFDNVSKGQHLYAGMTNPKQDKSKNGYKKNKTEPTNKNDLFEEVFFVK